MKVYDSEHIRNLALVGHGASGKTTLVNAMAWQAGSCGRMGSVEQGHALTDFTPDEIEHQISINVALAYAEHMDTKVNLIDTPGYLDFVGEVKAGLRVADSACVVVNGVAGVEVGTERVWEFAADESLPRFIFVSMMDKEHADFEAVFRQIREGLSPRAIPVEVPIGQGLGFRGLCNLFSEKAHLYKDGAKGEREIGEIPDEVRAEYDRYRQSLIETVAETDDTLIERYLEGEAFQRDEVLKAMKSGMARGELFPVFCGAAADLKGVRSLLQKVVELVPAPTERQEIRATRPGNGEKVFVPPKGDAPLSALVFKTTTEPHVGELSYFRVFSGGLQGGQDVYNSTQDKDERLAHIGVMQGKERTEVPRLNAGDLGENVTTRGLDLLALPRRARLTLGAEALIEITGLRNPCVQMDRFQDGLMEAVLDRDADGELVRRSGVMAIVLRGGDVKPGDPIAVVLPADHVPLRPV